jgi:hypothetical protein|tara:strand:+ start:139 stop:675 length:537 start_codon:yes stop_codon:yes gene_type:complete
MFKTFTNFLKSDNAKWVFVAIVLCIVAYSLLNYSNGKGLVMDGMSTGVRPSCSLGSEVFDSAQPSNYDQPEASVPSDIQTGSDYKQLDTASPQDLLPTDKNSEFAKLNPVNAGQSEMPDLLQAGSLIGVDTIGQTLKNPNLQLRSEPAIPKQQVGPWNNSTFEPDLSRVPLELGCGEQ